MYVSQYIVSLHIFHAHIILCTCLKVAKSSSLLAALFGWQLLCCLRMCVNYD